MEFDRPQTKLEAKRIIKESKGKIIWQAALFLLITLAISQLYSMLTGIAEFNTRINEDWENDLEILVSQYTEEELMFELDDYVEDSMELLVSYYPRVSPISILIAFLLIVMNAIVSAGFEWWCLLNMRRQPCDFRNMFDGFGFTFKLIGLIFIRGLLVTIGTLFFIVPGIILDLCYSQSTYIMFEDPSIGVIQCLRKSRKLMNGHKGDYFVMLLSFFGWTYLSALLTEIIGMAFIAFGLTVLVAFSSIFFEIWLTPYMGLTRAGFYNYLTGYTAPTEQALEQPQQEDNTL